MVYMPYIFIYTYVYMHTHIPTHMSALPACLYLHCMHLVSIEAWKRMSITSIPDSCERSMGAGKRTRSSVRSKSTLNS